MRLTRHAAKAFPLAGLGVALAAVLSGCGGASTSSSSLAPTPDSGPVIYGLNAQAAVGGTFQEASGLGSSGTQVGVLTGATKYTTDSGAAPLPAYTSNFSTGIPLGFATGGVYITGPVGAALPTTDAGAVVFRTYISTGAKGGNTVDLDTNSVVLTSSEAAGFSQKLTFDGAGIGTGALGQGQYTTGSFALPAALATTGVHSLTASVADVNGQKSHTDFAFVEVSPSDVALFLQNFIVAAPTTKNPAATAASAITAGNTVTIDGSAGIGTYPSGYTATTADAQGTVVLFTTPGVHTVTETDPKGAVVQTSTFTVAAEAVGTTVFDVPLTEATTTAAAKPHVVLRAVKH